MFSFNILFRIFCRSSALRESVTQHLYGVSKKDHINYSFIGGKGEEAEVSKSNQQPTDQSRIVLPSFEEMINYVYEMNQKRLSNSSAQRYVYGRITLAYSYESFIEVDKPFAPLSNI